MVRRRTGVGLGEFFWPQRLRTRWRQFRFCQASDVRAHMEMMDLSTRTHMDSMEQLAAILSRLSALRISP
jgi:hypothetical protein